MDDDQDARPARYEPVAPLPRPWERRAGLDHRPAAPAGSDDAPAPGPRRRFATRAAAARSVAARATAAPRLVREVAGGVRSEAERVAVDAEGRARGAVHTVAARRGVPTPVVGAAIVVVAGTALLVTADPWAPSSGGRSLLAWAVAATALGLAAGRPGTTVAATFRAMLLPAAAVAALAPLSHAETPFAWALLAVPAMGVGGALLVGLAAAAARAASDGAAVPAGVVERLAARVPALAHLRPTLPPRLPAAPRLAPRAAVAATVVAALLAVLGVRADRRVVDVAPDRPALVSERTGTFRGVGLGTSPEAVRRRLGRPVVAPDGARTAALPLDAPGDLALPADLPAGETWRYPGVALVVAARRVRAMVVADPRAQTAAGVGIGDSLEVARRAYAGLSCGGVRRGGAPNPAYPACRSRLPGREGLRRVGIVLAGDPVQSVTLRRGERGPLLEPRR